MNEQDQDRLKNKSRRATVTDINAYKASMQARTGSGYIDPGTQSWLMIAAFIVFCVLVALRIAR